MNKIFKEDRSRELICPICTIQFTTHHVTKKFCSNKCYLKDRQRRIGEWLKKDKIKKRIYKTIVCPICSIEFTTHNKGVKFCSKACLLIRTKILLSEYRQKPENKKKSADRVKNMMSPKKKRKKK